jgi:hypothetical protein
LKTTVISLTEDTIRFIVSGIDNAFANTLPSRISSTSITHP